MDDGEKAINELSGMDRSQYEQGYSRALLALMQRARSDGQDWLDDGCNLCPFQSKGAEEDDLDCSHDPCVLEYVVREVLRVRDIDPEETNTKKRLEALQLQMEKTNKMITAGLEEMRRLRSILGITKEQMAEGAEEMLPPGTFRIRKEQIAETKEPAPPHPTVPNAYLVTRADGSVTSLIVPFRKGDRVRIMGVREVYLYQYLGRTGFVILAREDCPTDLHGVPHDVIEKVT